MDINTKLNEERNRKRGEIQDYILNDWISNNRWGAYLASMGLGKGRIIAQAILSTLNDEESYNKIINRDIPILIQVSSTILRDEDTVNEIINWGVDKELIDKGIIQLVCYQTSFRWRKDKNIGLLISDECDYALTESYSKVFNVQNPVYNLALSGTFIDSKVDLAKDLKYFPDIRFRYPISQAQEDGIINKTKVIIHEVPLYTEKNIKINYRNKKTKKPDFFYTSEKDNYEYIEKEILIQTIKINRLRRDSRDYDLSAREIAEAIKQLPKAENRLKYLIFSPNNKNSRTNVTYTLKSLTDYTIKLKDSILHDPKINLDNEHSKPNKVIIFARLTKTIDLITKNGFHGNTDREDVNEVVKEFNRNEIRDTGVVQKANRGINYVNLNHCIGHSVPSSDTPYLQGTKGRMTRLPIYRNAYIHILVSYYNVKSPKTGIVVKKYCRNKAWADSFLRDETNDIYYVNSIEESVDLVQKLEKESLEDYESNKG